MDSGELGRVIDSRYKSWTKEWHDVPDNIVLPRVCPIRLGKTPSIEGPTDWYEYVPLDAVADEIRVINIMPSTDHSVPIIAHIAHCPIHCEVTFTALSYRWSVDGAQTQIIANGQKMLIKSGLEATLRAVRMQDKVVPLWVDAICINQSDTTERSRQIPRMGTIYDNAALVISYAGPATNDSDLALEMIKLIKELNILMMIWNDKDEMCAALYKLLCRSYFRRAWVLQEL
ncbi:hypothetical protein BAUCODRAFT_75005, partial [Baudoinia panamericana UAMH 10762]